MKGLLVQSMSMGFFIYKMLLLFYVVRDRRTLSACDELSFSLISFCSYLLDFVFRQSVENLSLHNMWGGKLVHTLQNILEIAQNMHSVVVVLT